MKVVFIGSGNVATHMAKAFKATGHVVTQVWSANPDHAAVLASAVDADTIYDFSDLDAAADLIVIAVKDDAIAEIAAKLTNTNALTVHTSGATDLSVLAGLKHYGVLYPLQTFSKAKELDFRKVPLGIEANEPTSLSILKTLAESLSDSVFTVDSQQRRLLHVAAAFACNFVNQMYTLSYTLLDQNGLDFGLLRPLIQETADKVQHLLPAEAQTGPAVRHDEKTLSAHLNLLQDQPELKNIYQTLSDSIKKTHQY